MNTKPLRSTCSAKFREETVTGVNGDRISDFGGRNDSWYVEVTFGGAGRADADRFVSKAHVHQVAVCTGVHRYGFDAELFTGPQNSESNLAAVGNQDFIKHWFNP